MHLQKRQRRTAQPLWEGEGQQRGTAQPVWDGGERQLETASEFTTAPGRRVCSDAVASVGTQRSLMSL